MLVHISSIHISVSFRPVRQLDKHTRQPSFLFGCFVSSGPSTMVLSLSFLLFPPILFASRGKRNPFHCVVFIIACRNWRKSMLHISPSLFPFPFPINRVLCPLIVPKIYRPMSIIVFCCFVFSCSVSEASFFFFFCVTGRHEIAFFFFFHLVCSYTSSAVIRTAYINNSCNKSCCIFISSLLGLAEKSL